ncbi:unnamed protein product [Nippostrongylus brasiliensis]|uniref:UBX domain-containing protein n=1 Tax=Nippostrongylus brasiliensis TaxID=27835 RepID=A0A0N4XJ82_NIPBR|nr:unnamed protein product [Nippostrongylus brasiliensis]
MSTVVDQLVDMGFERARAEYAYAKTGNGALEAVNDAGANHAGAELTEMTPGSYKSKSGHENFSESTEVIHLLCTLHIVVDQEAEMRLFFEVVKAIAEERKRAKQEEAAARQRVLEQIRLDKPFARVLGPLNRYRFYLLFLCSSVVSRSIDSQFHASLIQLSAVRLWLELNHSDGAPFTLLMPFPRKVMTDEDYEKPLKELGIHSFPFSVIENSFTLFPSKEFHVLEFSFSGLVPSANFVMTR